MHKLISRFDFGYEKSYKKCDLQKSWRFYSVCVCVAIGVSRPQGTLIKWCLISESQSPSEMQMFAKSLQTQHSFDLQKSILNLCNTSKNAIFGSCTEINVCCFWLNFFTATT